MKRLVYLGLGLLTLCMGSTIGKKAESQTQQASLNCCIPPVCDPDPQKPCRPLEQ